MMPRSTRTRPANPVAILRRFVVAVVAVAVVAVSGCDAATVSRVAAARGITLTDEQAAAVAAYLAETPASYIESKWASTGQARTALRVAGCESAGRPAGPIDPTADNPTSTASGVFQLVALHWRGRFNPFNWRANIDYAYKLWAGSGWGPWKSSRSCWS